jgi:hypothetical protein
VRTGVSHLYASIRQPAAAGFGVRLRSTAGNTGELLILLAPSCWRGSILSRIQQQEQTKIMSGGIRFYGSYFAHSGFTAHCGSPHHFTFLSFTTPEQMGVSVSTRTLSFLFGTIHIQVTGAAGL